MNRKETIQWMKPVGAVVALFLAAMLIISMVERKQEKRIMEVNIEITALPGGDRLIEKEDIHKIIERSFGYHFEGVKIGMVDVERLERVLEEDPFIINADAYVDAGQRMYIMVEQRQPVLRIIDNNSLNYYLDQDGFKMPLSKHFTARVLVVSGNIPPFVPNFLERKKHTLKDVFHLTTYILNDEFLKPMIEQIYVTNRGQFTLIPKVGRQKIQLGSIQDMEKKFDYLKVFYQEAMPREGWRKYRNIDLRYEGQIVCK